jgi:hypothetical protein
LGTMTDTYYILLAYSPVLVFALIMIIGTIVETFQHLNKND